MAKARVPWLATLMLGIIAGGFIGLGALFPARDSQRRCCGGDLHQDRRSKTSLPFVQALFAGVRCNLLVPGKYLRNALTQSVVARTVSVNGEGSFNPSAPARLDLQPLAIPRHPLACAMPIQSRSSTWRTSLMTLARSGAPA